MTVAMYVCMLAACIRMHWYAVLHAMRGVHCTGFFWSPKGDLSVETFKPTVELLTQSWHHVHVEITQCGPLCTWL